MLGRRIGSRIGWLVCVFVVALGVAASSGRAQGRQAGPPAAPTNLTVLTPDVSIPRVMAGFNTALGVQCAYCHLAGNFASDGNPKKNVARAMLRMVKQASSRFPDNGNDFLNSKYLPFPEGKQYVTCYTCHRGSTVPVANAPDPHGPDRAPEPGTPARAGGGRRQGAAADANAASGGAAAVEANQADGGPAAAGARNQGPGRGRGRGAAAANLPPGRGAQQHKNMVFLPSDVDTGMVMPAFRAAIGVECNFCHVSGDHLERGHANERDLDENPKKLIARSMIGMLEQINTALFPGEQIDIAFAASSIVPDGKHYVTCYMCHRGSRLPATEAPTAASRGK